MLSLLVTILITVEGVISSSNGNLSRPDVGSNMFRGLFPSNTAVEIATDVDVTGIVHSRIATYKDISPTDAPSGRRFLTIAPTAGADYATQCQSSYVSYNSASSSWSKANHWVSEYTSVIDGVSWSVVTDYEGATSLCDGHPRVQKSPATPTQTRTITFAAGADARTTVKPITYKWAYAEPSPTCSITPEDCDPLWVAYTKSSAAYVAASQITPPPMTPPCMNQTAASSYYEAIKRISGCGDCTIFGDDVRLLFFPVPTTVSRDMCASTPSATMTHFNLDDGALDVYAGKSYGNRTTSPGAVTAVVDQHILTSGTAYISIGKVWARDRCTNPVGTTIQDVIIAMHSESILSLRYSQDHFQYWASSSTQTGYPVSYADFNQPVPWSAWNGMTWCQGPNWGQRCDVIYEDEFRPQLAIPGAIRQLDARWASCQNWFGGLYDPPLTLQTQEAFAVPTFPAVTTPTALEKLVTTPEPASTVLIASTTASTALPAGSGHQTLDPAHKTMGSTGVVSETRATAATSAGANGIPKQGHKYPVEDKASAGVANHGNHGEVLVGQTTIPASTSIATTPGMSSTRATSMSRDPSSATVTDAAPEPTSEARCSIARSLYIVGAAALALLMQI